MTPLKSSNLHAVGRDGDDLLVQFKGKDGPGHTYRYAGAAQHHDDLVASDSPGSFFHAKVRSAYEGKKVEKE